MTTGEKLALLEEMLELEDGELKKEMELAEMENWNSMAKLFLIALMDDEFDKELTGEQINNFVTVKDILDFMERD